MPPAARISDMHTCPMVTPGTPPVPHVGGPVVSGAPTVLIGFMPAARISDQCVCAGPPDVIVKGSATVIICGMPAARIGDSTAHGGVIVAGCPTVLIGDFGSGGASPVPPGMAGSGQASSSQQGPLSSQSGSGGMNISGDQSAVAPPGQAGRQRSNSSSDQPKTWITVELRDFFGEPIPNEPVRVTLDRGQVLSGTTDAQGRAHFEGVDPDSGVVTFPNIPENTIDESAGSLDSPPGVARSGWRQDPRPVEPAPELELAAGAAPPHSDDEGDEETDLEPEPGEDEEIA